MTQSPRVTVLVPTYNGARHITRCLDSLLRQHYSSWTAIVGDDGSTDATPTLLKSCHDARIQIVQPTQQLGGVLNTNRLIELASTEFTAILHQDDWWEPAFLAVLVNMLDQHPSAILATCGVRVSGLNRPTTAGFHIPWGSEGLCSSAQALRILAGPNPMYVVGVLARSALYQRMGGFDARLPLTYDWRAWMAASQAGDFAVTSQVLANYGEHPDSISQRALGTTAWAQDYVRLDEIVHREWSNSTEPLPDVRRALRRTVWGLVLGQALKHAKAGRAPLASETLRIASRVTTGARTVVFTRMLQLSVRLLGRRPTAFLARRFESAARASVKRVS